ncbi:WD40 repeat-like protein, partial [Ramicandelaber brevisporus]
MSTTPGQRLLYLAPQPSTARAYAVRLEANPTGTHLMYANGRSIVVRELANPDHAQVYSGHTKQVTVARFAPTGNYVASGDVRGNVRIWDFADSEHRVKYEAQGLISGGVSEISGIRDIAWDAESKRVLAVGDGRETLGHVFMWDSGNSTGTISGHTRTVNACSMRPKRPFRAATASDDQTVCFYSGAPYKHELTIRDHAGFVNDVRFSPDGALFASVGQDKCIFVYDGDTGDRAVDLASAAASAAGSGSEAKHKGTIFSLAWSPDSTQLITSSADSTVRLWDVAAQKLISTFTIHPDVRRPGFTRFDTQQVGNLWTPSHMVSLSSDGTLNYLDPRDHNGRPARAVTGLQKPIVASAYSVKETTLFAGSNDGRVAAWDIGSAL